MSNPLPKLYGPYGSAAIAYADQFPAYGVNAAWFHMFDETAFAACTRAGIAACVEFKVFRADFAQHPELIPIGADGQPIRYGRLVQGVCLSKQWFLDYTEENLLAGVRAFQPAGIWLDYLTGAGWFEEPQPDLQEHCFCVDCIADFCNSTGIDATAPAEILARHQTAWNRYKCERVARFGARYAGIIRRHLPGCVIGAYMCPWRPAEFDGALTRIFAQDYNLLAPSIDIFTPLIYVKKSGRQPAWAREVLEAAPGFVPADRPVQLILDALDFPASLDTTVESSIPSYGLQMFSGAEIFRDPAKAAIFAAALEQIQKAE
ncbi:MAG: hypothetical protein DWI57_06515 [Chloroflexi bacterium]|nr:MAG: hypothetical protein DWI57_06515 [Chloroflexota bacterium]